MILKSQSKKEILESQSIIFLISGIFFFSFYYYDFGQLADKTLELSRVKSLRGVSCFCYDLVFHVQQCYYYYYKTNQTLGCE